MQFCLASTQTSFGVRSSRFDEGGGRGGQMANIRTENFQDLVLEIKSSNPGEESVDLASFLLFLPRIQSKQHG